jgi:hypothetical protein
MPRPVRDSVTCAAVGNLNRAVPRMAARPPARACKGRTALAKHTSCYLCIRHQELLQLPHSLLHLLQPPALPMPFRAEGWGPSRPSGGLRSRGAFGLYWCLVLERPARKTHQRPAGRLWLDRMQMRRPTSPGTCRVMADIAGPRRRTHHTEDKQSS